MFSVFYRRYPDVESILKSNSSAKGDWSSATIKTLEEKLRVRSSELQIRELLQEHATIPGMKTHLKPVSSHLSSLIIDISSLSMSVVASLCNKGIRPNAIKVALSGGRMAQGQVCVYPDVVLGRAADTSTTSESMRPPSHIAEPANSEHVAINRRVRSSSLYTFRLG
ncbi:hypothetical protein J6590_007108 [Homalodisca vitripennis]|nr:hypothetical protein J6590_007108 [Homalodisca vitripennis]